MSELIYLGTITKAHGLRGDLKVHTEDEREGRFQPGMKLLANPGEIPLTVRRVSGRGLMSILTFEEIESLEQAQSLLHKDLFIEEDQLQAPEEGQFYIKDLVGCHLVDQAGRDYGLLKQVLTYPVNDVYEVETPRGRLVYVPAIQSIVQKIDIDQKTIFIEPMEGLFDED